MDADRVFARFLQEEEVALASQIANDRNCAQLLEEEEHINDGVLGDDGLRLSKDVAHVVATLAGRAHDQHIVNSCRAPAGPSHHPVL